MVDIIREQKTRPTPVKIMVMAALVLAGVAINDIGAAIASLLGLPFYLDVIGTILASMLGGFIPGILVGLLSPIIAAMTVDPMAISYTMVNVLIAVLTAWFYGNGWLSKWNGIAINLLLDSLAGGFIGGIITWYIYGSEAEDASSALVHGLITRVGLSPFSSELLGGFIVDIGDKAISLAVALIIMKLLPQAFKNQFKIHAWKQAPLTSAILRELRKKRSRKLSLRIKLVALLAAASVVIGIAAIYISYVIYYNSAINNQKSYGLGTAELVATCIDGDMVETYIEEGRSAPGYQKVSQQLKDIRDHTAFIEYVYVYQIRKDGCYVVFDTDTEDLKGEEPGTCIEFDSTFLPYVPTLLEGGRIEPIESDDKYGWLLTFYEPIYDSNGDTVAYAGVDIAMDNIRKDARKYIIRVISTFLGIFALALAIGVFFAEYQVILPLNTMAYTASKFSENKETALQETAELFHKLLIYTGDETENLYNAFSEMTDENLKYLMDIQKKNETINRMQNSLILVLADMVESRDQNTGDHVKKTSEYTRLIMDELVREGIYTDQLTDSFRSDVYRSAPLHDIGKISISDAILNKNGRLDDQEYELMKGHTTAGANILDRVIATVPDDDTEYLNEAKTMALYHHEKWNGSGYPYGLSGEDIPLSARIMAVADVFDALVSNRSYKKGFSFEKSIEIIRESSGTHFDPKVAGAFLNAQDKAKEIMEKNYNTYG